MKNKWTADDITMISFLIVFPIALIAFWQVCMHDVSKAWGQCHKTGFHLECK